MTGCSIILINYKTATLVIDCLRTFFSMPLPTNFEVIVVDNFSQDDSESRITTAFPGVQWLQMGYNSGFSRANNAGIRKAKGEIVLLLNSDTLNENNALQKCVERFSNADYIACGIQLLNADRTPQISGNYFIKGGVNQLMSLPYTGRFIRWLGFTLGVKKTNVKEAIGMVEVDWITGAFLMVRKDAIEKAGLMDEDFFLYFEEIEWCGRLRKLGKMCIYGDLNIVHLQGATTNEVFRSAGQGYYNLYDKKGLQLMVSGLLRIRKQYGPGWFFFHLAIYLFTIPVFFGGVIFNFAFKRNSYSFQQFKGYVRNCMKLLSICPRIIINRPYFYKML